MNTDDGSSTTILLEKPRDDRAALLAADFTHLQDFDFYNFNYFTFEHDIIDMMPGEMEWWFRTTFEPWLVDLDETYIDIDYETLSKNFDNQTEKRIFMLKIVNFVMFILPYEIMKKVFRGLGIEDNFEANTFLRDEENLNFLREEILARIDDNALHVSSFVDTLKHFEKIAKKNLDTEAIVLLDEHVQKQNFFLEIFKRIVQETDMYKLRDLIIKMLENDSANIL